MLFTGNAANVAGCEFGSPYAMSGRGWTSPGFAVSQFSFCNRDIVSIFTVVQNFQLCVCVCVWITSWWNGMPQVKQWIVNFCIKQIPPLQIWMETVGVWTVGYDSRRGQNCQWKVRFCLAALHSPFSQACINNKREKRPVESWLFLRAFIVHFFYAHSIIHGVSTQNIHFTVSCNASAFAFFYPFQYSQGAD